MVKLAIVFQSGKGHTKALAESILKGINSVEGATGSLFEIRGQDIHDGRFVNESLMGALDSCDGIVLGCATYMGSASAIIKAFLESAPGNNWSGGARSDLNRLGSWVGAMGQSNADEDKPSIGDIDTAERLGARVAVITRRIKDGVAFETERLSEKDFRKNNIARRDALAGHRE